MAVRFGVGRSGLSRSFDNLPQLGRPADYEPVTFQGFSSFLDQQNVINGIAKPVSLRATPGLALVPHFSPFPGCPRNCCPTPTVFRQA